MGAKSSILSQGQLEEYAELTYLTKSEVLYILKKFSKLGRDEISQDIHFRFHASFVVEEFPQLKFNPYREQIFKIFSRYNDHHMSFEDFLDLCSAMSSNCPLRVKAAWAFKLFDYNDDHQITKDDLYKVLDSLTRNSPLSSEEKSHIADVLLAEMDLQATGGMSQLEFLHAMTKMPEFATVFSFRP